MSLQSVYSSWEDGSRRASGRKSWTRKKESRIKRRRRRRRGRQAPLPAWDHYEKKKKAENKKKEQGHILHLVAAATEIGQRGKTATWTTAEDAAVQRQSVQEEVDFIHC